MRDPALDRAAAHPDQTYFKYSPPHYSPYHAQHTWGSQAPVQQDLFVINRHTGRAIGQGVGVPFYGQTTLDMYR